MTRAQRGAVPPRQPGGADQEDDGEGEEGPGPAPDDGRAEGRVFRTVREGLGVPCLACRVCQLAAVQQGEVGTATACRWVRLRPPKPRLLPLRG